MESITIDFDRIPEKEKRVRGDTLFTACKAFYENPDNLATHGKQRGRPLMYKIVNLAGRISLFFVIQVAMYYAMFDPLLRIFFDLPIAPLMFIASWVLLIVVAIIDATILPVFNYDKGTDAHVK